METLTHPPAPLARRIADWSPAAQACFAQCRRLFLASAKAAEVGTLDEALKWGQPAWRPTSPRTGSTLRANWDAGTPDLLWLYVDCKTDLAARMAENYPKLARNDGRRQMAIAVEGALPEQALRHLATMTFTYHRKAR